VHQSIVRSLERALLSDRAVSGLVWRWQALFIGDAEPDLAPTRNLRVTTDPDAVGLAVTV